VPDLQEQALFLLVISFTKILLVMIVMILIAAIRAFNILERGSSMRKHYLIVCRGSTSPE
jgi:hypothetical protein